MIALRQNKLEAQYAARREASIAEVADLKQQLELRSNEIRSLNATIDSMKNVNEELKVYAFSHMTLFWLISLPLFAARFRCDVCGYRGWQEPS